MNRDQIFEKVRKVLCEQLGLNGPEGKAITLDSHPVEDLGADSLDQVEIIMAFEEEFEVDMPDETAESIGTVGDAVDALYMQLHDGVWPNAGGRYVPKFEQRELPKLIRLNTIVKCDFMTDGPQVFAKEFNARMASAAKLEAARITDLEGSDAFEIAMGGRLGPVDTSDIISMIEDSGFVFQHVVEHIERFAGEGDKGESYEIQSYVSYTLPKWAQK